MLPLPPETCALGFRGTVPTSLVRSFPSRLGSSSSNAGFLSSAPASLVLSMNYKHYTVYFELDNINLFTICSLGACRTTPATSRVNACICVGWNFESSTVKLKRGTLTWLRCATCAGKGWRVQKNAVGNDGAQKSALKRERCASVVENAKTAARDPRGDIATAETQGCACIEQPITHQTGFIAVGIHRAFGQDQSTPILVTASDRRIWIHPVGGGIKGVIRWSGDRERGHLDRADERAGHSPIQTPNHACGQRPLLIEKGGLFDGSPQFTHAGHFSHVLNAATKFPFRPGASDCEHGRQPSESYNKCNTHTKIVKAL